MQNDIIACKQLGADGVVLGMLDLDGRVDSGRTLELVNLAVPLKVTYHRAFDLSSDLLRSLRDLQTTGVHCILTSGGEKTAAEGADTLKQLVEAADGSLNIMAGGGIEEDNVGDLIEQTGVREIHASVKFPMASRMRYQNPKISLGAVEGREYERFIVLQENVRNLLRAARERKS